MSHEKVFGFCENLCEREVEPKSRTENLYNPNLLVNCDDFAYMDMAKIDGTIDHIFNVTLNNMIYYGKGYAPLTVESSGDIEMRYQITGLPTLSDNRLPMTLQVRFGETGATVGTGITIKTYVFDETGDEFTEIMGSVTWRITLTGYSVKIYWTKAAGVESEYQFAGAKLELGNVPTRYDISNTLGKTIDLVWQESKNQFEQKSNKVTSISSSSTNTQYPSAKAVYGLTNKMRVVGENISWKDTPNDNAQWYFYENANSSTLDLPAENCVVIVFEKLVNRGVAFAFGWAGTATDRAVWKNTNHDGWHGWTPLHTN